MKTYDPSAAAAFAGDTPIAMYIQLDFASGTQRYWTGGADTTWNGFSWIGAGGVVSIGEIRETEELIATTVPLQLAGTSDALIALLLSEKVRGRLCTLWFAPLGATLDPIGTPPIEFRGKLDEPAIRIEAPEATVQVNVVSALADFARPKERRYSNEDQQLYYPGDTIFDGIHETAEMVVVWPNKEWFKAHG